MQLTTGMKAEMETMSIRVQQVFHKVFPFFGGVTSLEIKESIDASIQELTTHKVRLENLFCETDIKEQDHLQRKFDFFHL